MGTETENLILQELQDIKKFIANIDNEETDTEGALKIIRRTNQRDLKTLRTLGYFPRAYKRPNGKNWNYFKTECYEVREKLNKGEILIFNQFNKAVA